MLVLDYLFCLFCFFDTEGLRLVSAQDNFPGIGTDGNDSFVW